MEENIFFQVGGSKFAVLRVDQDLHIFLLFFQWRVTKNSRPFLVLFFTRAKRWSVAEAYNLYLKGRRQDQGGHSALSSSSQDRQAANRGSFSSACQENRDRSSRGLFPRFDIVVVDVAKQRTRAVAFPALN